MKRWSDNSNRCIRVSDRRVNLATVKWAVLRINPNAILIPDHDFITLISREIEYIGRQVRMPVSGNMTTRRRCPSIIPPSIEFADNSANS